MRVALALKGLVVAGIVAASFGGALVFGMGGVDALTAKPTVVDAGGFRFTYPKAWKQLRSSELPSSGAAHGVGGQVVAALCTPMPGKAKGSGTGKAKASGTATAKTAAAAHGAVAAGCASPVDVVYVLFSKRASFPNPTTLEHQLDTSFRSKLRGFRKIGSHMAVTADGTPYLQYELTFRTRNGVRHQILAAYRSGNSGVIALANGPHKTFDRYRAPIISMLEHAHEPQGH